MGKININIKEPLSPETQTRRDYYYLFICLFIIYLLSICSRNVMVRRGDCRLPGTIRRTAEKRRRRRRWRRTIKRTPTVRGGDRDFYRYLNFCAVMSRNLISILININYSQIFEKYLITNVGENVRNYYWLNRLKFTCKQRPEGKSPTNIVFPEYRHFPKITINFLRDYQRFPIRLPNIWYTDFRWLYRGARPPTGCRKTVKIYDGNDCFL